ncbi:hypothetical protein PENSUB_11333 [Penicillium subrubescens]|uniref:Uncharacterized protein n=1 Tax=Penicillium subrubescens TaxID=1316194 RepID=A0A1Q5T3W5_9EURO|nr:hypothetical protein PENSUB_11333 [Penicillium subrubescens]
MGVENQMWAWEELEGKSQRYFQSWLEGRRCVGGAKRRGGKDVKQRSGGIVRKVDGAEACAALPVSAGLSDQSLTGAKHTSVESM